MPVRDTNLNLSPEASDLPLIATNRLSADTIEINSTPLTGLAVRLDVGYTMGNTLNTAGALNVIIHAASSTPVASSDPIAGQLDTPIVLSSETAGYTVQKIIPFTTNKRYVRAEFALSGLAASDSPAFSKVDAYIVENVGLAWDRNVGFE